MYDLGSWYNGMMEWLWDLVWDDRTNAIYMYYFEAWHFFGYFWDMVGWLWLHSYYTNITNAFLCGIVVYSIWDSHDLACEMYSHITCMAICDMYWNSNIPKLCTNHYGLLCFFCIIIRIDEMWRRYNIGNIEIPHLLQVPPLLKDDYI